MRGRSRALIARPGCIPSATLSLQDLSSTANPMQGGRACLCRVGSIENYAGETPALPIPPATLSLATCHQSHARGASLPLQ